MRAEQRSVGQVAPLGLDYNLSTRNFGAPGTFEVTGAGTGGDVLLGTPAQTVTIGD
jgi:hypothetical protein